MGYEESLEKWIEHLRFEEEIARRNPFQYRTYLDNIYAASERKGKINEGYFQEGDGWLDIQWR